MDSSNLFMILAPFIIIQVILLITALVDLIKRPQTLGPKWLWAIIIICISILSTTLCMSNVRKENKRMLRTAKFLTKKYRHAIAEHELSLSLDEHNRIALMRPNGAGKTTTLR